MKDDISLLRQKKSFELANETWCLLGLPFHAATREEACRFTDQCIQKGSKMVLSTPNVNFVGLAHKNKSFHEQALASEISVADGMPLFWCARFLGIPLPEKVSGSDISEDLWGNTSGKRKKVYFFGGEENVAQEAYRKTCASSPGLTGVGFCNPGHGAMEELSRDEYIQGINSAEPDMVFVALGAKRGMEWIHRNRNRINAQILAPFGAVLNFFSGKVVRAPRWVQRAGMEWVWRIYQEPKLWTRYFGDGIIFLYLFFTRVLPLKRLILQHRAEEEKATPPLILIGKSHGKVTIAVEGVCNRKHRGQVRKIFKEAVNEELDVVVDLEKTSYVESSFLGSLLDLWRCQHLRGRSISVVRASEKIKKIFELSMIDKLFMPAQGLAGAVRRKA